MKYLKYINEGKYSPNELAELKNYCEIHLVDMVDKGYGISCLEEFYRVLIILHYNNGKPFRWSKTLEDDFIPFFEMIQSDYPLDFMIKNGISKHIRIVPYVSPYTLSYNIPDDIYFNKNELDNMQALLEDTLIYSISFYIKQKSYA